MISLHQQHIRCKDPFLFLNGDLHTVEGTKLALDRELVWFAATENQPMAV